MNFIFKIILLFLLLTNQSLSEIIKDFKILGNKRISDATIVLFSKLKINQDIDNDDLNNVIKELFSTNYFKDVKIEFKNQVVEIIVEENPIVQSLVFNGIKKNNIISALKENIILKEKSPFIKSVVKKDETNIINILRSNGFYFSNVNSKIIINDNHTVDLIYDVDLGKEAHIKNIKFIGDKKYKDGKLRNIIVSEESKFWKFISKTKFLDVNRVKLDEKLLTNFYKNNGYYNVKVESTSAQIISEDNFELVFNINSGKRYYFDKLKLNIPNDFDENNFTEINKLLSKLIGKLYSLKSVESILDEIEKLLLTNDYAFFDVTYNEELNDDKISFTINLIESDKYYVERINLYGNYITNERVIRNRLFLDEGDPYNKILVNNSANEIRALGIFSNVTYETIDGSTDKTKVLNFTVTETPTGEIMAGAGTGTSGSSITFGIKEKNYLGEGIKLDANLTLADTGIEGLFSTNIRNYKNSDKDLNTSLENSSIDQMSKFGYKTTKTGFSIGTTYEQFKNVYFSPSFSNYYETMKTDSSASDTRKKQEGNYIDSAFNYRFVLNKLDQNFQPTDGYKSSFSQSIPLVSDDYTIINALEYAAYQSFKEDYIFGFNVLLKSANSLNGDDIRASKRLYVPSRRLRGFESGKIGPIDSGDFIGGNYMSVVNLSTNLPNLFTEVQNLDFTIFFDTANLWGVDFDSSLDNSKIRSSTGIAVNWYTPIGPLSFSFAQPITKASSDVEETYRFDIGTTF